MTIFIGAFLKTGALGDFVESSLIYLVILINMIFLLSWFYYFFSILNVSWKDILSNCRQFKCVEELFDEDRRKEVKLRKRNKKLEEMVKLRKDVPKLELTQKVSMLRVKEYISRFSDG